MIDQSVSQEKSSLLKLVAMSVMFALSVLAIVPFGATAVVVWCLISAIVAGLYLSPNAQSALFSLLPEDNSTDGAGESEADDQDAEDGPVDELREFVYLDSLAVQSLLASLHVDISEESTRINQQSERVKENAAVNAGVSGPGIGSFGANVGTSTAETEGEILETSKKITDQYIFDVLYNELDDSGKISTFSFDWDSPPSNSDFNLDSVDVVKITGTAKTDPVYRLANLVSLLSRVEVLQEYQDSDNRSTTEISQIADDLKEIIFSNQIGVQIDDGTLMSYVMSVDTDNLWVNDPRREFTDSREYTVLGRVVGEIPEDDEWDYIDLLRISDVIFDKESLRTVRELLTIFLDLLSDFRIRLSLEPLKDVSFQEMQKVDFEQVFLGMGTESGDSDDEDSETGIQVRIKDKTVCVEAPGLIIEPIAIYW